MVLVAITLEQADTDCFLFLLSRRWCQDSFWSESVVSSSRAFVPDERDSLWWGLGWCSPWTNMFSYMTHCSTDMWAILFCFCSEISNLILERYVGAKTKSTYSQRPLDCSRVLQKTCWQVHSFFVSFQEIENKRSDMFEWREEIEAVTNVL